MNENSGLKNCAVCAGKRWINIIGLPGITGGCCPKCNRRGKIPQSNHESELETLYASELSRAAADR